MKIFGKASQFLENLEVVRPKGNARFKPTYAVVRQYCGRYFVLDLERMVAVLSHFGKEIEFADKVSAKMHAFKLSIERG